MPKLLLGGKMNKDYWAFVQTIWAQPTNSTLRLIFADWLEDNGMLKASQRQKQYAKFIEQAYVIWERQDRTHAEVLKPAIMHKKRFKLYRYGTIDRPNQGHTQDFEIKKDGTIVLAPPSVGHNRRGARILRGRFVERRLHNPCLEVFLHDYRIMESRVLQAELGKLIPHTNPCREVELLPESNYETV